MAMPIAEPSPGTAMLGVLIDDLLGCAFFDRRGTHDGIVGAELSVSFPRPTGWHGPVLTAQARLESIDDDGGLGVAEVLDGAGEQIAAATMWGSFVDGVSQHRTVHTLPDPVQAAAATAAPLDLLGGLLEHHGTGVALTVPGTQAFANTMGMMHGGVQACAHDLVAAAANAQPALRTAALRVNYFRPVPLDGPVRFEAEVLRSGRRVSVIRTQTRDHAGRVCSVATVTLRRGPDAAAAC